MYSGRVKTRPPAVCPLFASDLQSRLCAVLFAHPEDWVTSAELRRRLGVSPAALHAELTRLLDAGLIERVAVERPFRYRANADSPLFEPVKAIVDRSVGVPMRLQDLLAGEEGIEAAGIFGSWARGAETLGSDIDVLVVGNVSTRKLALLVRPLEREIAKEINVVQYTPAELRTRGSSPFIRSVRRLPVYDLIGDLHATLDAA